MDDPLQSIIQIEKNSNVLDKIPRQEVLCSILREIFRLRLKVSLSESGKWLVPHEAKLVCLLSFVSRVTSGNPFSRTLFFPLEKIYEMISPSFWKELHSEEILGKENAYFENRIRADLYACIHPLLKRFYKTVYDPIIVTSCPFDRVKLLAAKSDLSALMKQVVSVGKIDTEDSFYATLLKDLLLLRVFQAQQEAVENILWET